MNTLSGIHPVYKPKDPSRRYKGIVIVVILHILIGWGIISGTAKNVLVALKKPMEAVVIQEVIIPPPPPPPPPPPKKIEQPKTPKVEAPPPPFVPPPDVAPAVSNAPTIVSVAAPPPAPVVIAPPPPPPPPPPPLPKSVPKPADIGVICPTQVPPEMPRNALKLEIEGVVKARALIKDGAVKEVTILSGPTIFHSAVKASMMKYKCSVDGAEVLAVQEFVFKID